MLALVCKDIANFLAVVEWSAKKQRERDERVKEATKGDDEGWVYLPGGPGSEGTCHE